MSDQPTPIAANRGRATVVAVVFSSSLGIVGCTSAPRIEPLIIAHRGSSHDAPENTLAAFRQAWQQGADGIEGDFRLTADGEIVCLHDPTTLRTAGTELTCAESTLEQLRALDVGGWKGPEWRGERIPTLAEVLATLPADKRVYVEIKCGPEVIPTLRCVLRAAPVRADRVSIISFDEEVIAAAKRNLPELLASWLIEFGDDDPPPSARIDEIVSVAGRIGADSVGCETHPGIDSGFVRRLREAGLGFHVWTVNDSATARRFIALGADSITTDRPGWLREELG